MKQFLGYLYDKDKPPTSASHRPAVNQLSQTYLHVPHQQCGKRGGSPAVPGRLKASEFSVE